MRYRLEVGQKYKYLGVGYDDPDVETVVTVVMVESGYVTYEPGFYGATGDWPEEDFTSDFELVEEDTVEEGAVVTDDAVNHPAHYNSDPSGVECIQIARHRNFNIGNAFKYIWRAGLKVEEGKQDLDKEIEDLDKAIFCLQDEKKRLKGEYL